MGTTVEEPVSDHAVAIAGCGAVSALGLGIAPLAGGLGSNRSGLRPCPRFAGLGYQSSVCGWVPEEVVAELRAEDPSHADARALLFAAASLREALRSCAVHGVSPERKALVLSTTKGDVEALERLFRQQACSAIARRHLQPALLAEDLAEAHDLRGPVQCVSAACISGLLALQQGAALIGRGAADLVFVTGVDLISHFVLAGFTSLKSLDPDGCRPFDKARIGLSLGEGAATIVLVRRDLFPSAKALLTGWGSSNDANHLTGPSRDGSGLTMAITRALAGAKLTPSDIGYVNAHGTGTAYNDQMESLALRSVFGEAVPPLSSSKGMLGHTLGAAGVLETILCLLALEKQTLPGTPRLAEPDPIAPSSLIHGPRQAGDLRRVLKVNCGFAGTNAAIVLQVSPEATCGAAASVHSRADCVIHYPNEGADSAVILAASYVGPEGHGNDLSGLRPWPREHTGPFQQGELDALHWSLVFSDDATRFGRMDLMCRLGLIAAELLDFNFAAREVRTRERVGVCVETWIGSLITDVQFLRTPRPSLFTYTLPSTVIGEVCIRHRLQGPVLCRFCTKGQGRGVVEEAADWLQAGVVDLVLCLSCDAMTRELADTRLIPELSKSGAWHASALLLGRGANRPREFPLPSGPLTTCAWSLCCGPKRA